MGGSNSGRSHEPQQCGGAHLPNTLSSPNAAAKGGIGGPPEHRLPDDPPPQKAGIERYAPPPTTAKPALHRSTQSCAYRVRGSRGAEPPGREGGPALPGLLRRFPAI